MSSRTLNCYMSFYTRKPDPAATCSCVLVDGGEKDPAIVIDPKGTSLNTHLIMLTDLLTRKFGEDDGHDVELNVTMHRSNRNLFQTLSKVMRSAGMAEGYEGKIRDKLIAKTMKYENHTKPLTFETSCALVHAIVAINTPRHRLTVVPKYGAKRNAGVDEAYLMCTPAD